VLKAEYFAFLSVKTRFDQGFNDIAFVANLKLYINFIKS